MLKKSTMTAVAAAAIGAIALTGCSADTYYDTTTGWVESDNEGPVSQEVEYAIEDDAAAMNDATLGAWYMADHNGYDWESLVQPVTVINSTSRTTDYLVEVVAESRDGSIQYDIRDAYVTALEPGQSATADAVFIPSFIDEFDVKFRVIEVLRING